MLKGLYIHVPFCVKKCPYCDFYSVTDISLAEEYTNAAVRNIKHKNTKADTVYFGGGTPSLLTAEQTERILFAAEIEKNAEVTMECNPDTVDPRFLSDIHSAGVNRISFGVQSLDEKELKALGRIHGAEAAANAVNEAFKAGFSNISADIMIGTAFQTKKSLSETIEKLSALPLSHISAYLLKIEPETPYGRNKAVKKLLPDEDESAELYLEAVKKLEDNGFFQYEISNFSKKGFESKHNLKYWRCEEYYGIGPSAHSFIDGIRKAVPASFKSFIGNEFQEEYITEENGGSFEEKAMLALRLTKEGLIEEALGDKKELILYRAKPLIKAGFLRYENGRITLTPKGCLVSNEIICRLLLSEE